MKKFVISMLLVLSVMSVVFANGGKEIDFDPAPTKFEGGWRNAHEKYSDQVYVFLATSGNTLVMMNLNGGQDISLLRKTQSLFTKKMEKNGGMGGVMVIQYLRCMMRCFT